MNIDAALCISDLHKTFENGFQALNGIDLEVPEGAFYALLGPNGAGKSTTINILCSFARASSGQVKIFGEDIRVDAANAKRAVGLVPQEFNVNAFEKCIDVLIYQAGYYGMPRSEALPRAKELLARMDLSAKADTASRHLSGGMRRRLMIARALMHRPRLLILDEPTAGVDIEVRRLMWDYLRELNASGTTIILTTHYLEEAEALCDRVGIINQGRIVEQGEVSELLSRAQYETFVLDIQPTDRIVEVPGYVVHQKTPKLLEVEVPRDCGINRLIQELDRASIKVLGMRNKSNRLEEFFLRLVQQGRQNEQE